MGLLSSITGRGNGHKDAFPAARVRQALETIGASYDDVLSAARETISELEMRLLDLSEPGWLPLGTGEAFDFSREFLDGMVQRSRIFAIKNPLIKQQVRVYTNYVWGRGVTVTAQGAVNDVVQAFLSDRGNKRAFSGQSARARLNRSLMTDGSLVLRFFVNAATGRVRVRPLRFEEVRAPVRNPDDASEIWYWLRSFTKDRKPTQRLYPDLAYRPAVAKRPKVYEIPGAGAVDIEWDTPVYVLKVNDLEGMAFGIPETYAGIDWARAYKEYLENWAKFVRSLTRWAWKMKTTGDPAAVESLRDQIATQFGSSTGAAVDSNPAPTTGSVAIPGVGVEDLEPIKLGGATFPSEDGRRLLLMVAAGAGLPETFFGDVNTGNLATATTLDRPTELNFAAYQTMWGETYEDILSFVVDSAARAPSGPLRTLFDSEDTERGEVVLKDTDAAGEPVSRSVDIDWPPILERDPLEMVKAISLAVKTNAIDDAPLVARMLLTALGEEDIDDALKRLYPPEDEEPEAVPLAPLAAPQATPPTPQVADQETATEARLAEALTGLTVLLREPEQ